MNHKGGCQCGKVRYEVEIDLDHTAIECNCSICEKNGLLLSFVNGDAFKLVSGEGEMTEYRFNTEKIVHYFCKTCGVECYAQNSNAEGGRTYALNVRTIDDVELSKVTRMPFDGKSM
jgi:hypothetical protein